MRLNDERLEFIRQNRHEPPKKLAKALGVSVRKVERALRELGDVDAIRRARRRRVAAVALSVALLGGATYAVLRWRASVSVARAADEARRREAEAREAERAVYAALDRGERGREDEVARHLTSESESLRLASVRYLLSQPSGKHVASVLPLVEDPSERVRLGTIQLLAGAAHPGVDAALAKAAGSEKSGLAERTLALASLKKRPPSGVRPVARDVADALADPRTAVRRAAHEVLAQAFPPARVPFDQKPAELRAAWLQIVEVRH